MLSKFLEDMRKVELDSINLPCDKCNGDCCGASVTFTNDEITTLKKNYKSKFKRLTIVPTNDPNMSTIKHKGKDIDLINDKCIFLSNNKCSIYEHRPTICKDYGTKEYIQCPYNHLNNVPDSKYERTDLTFIAQLSAANFMVEHFSKYVNEHNVDKRSTMMGSTVLRQQLESVKTQYSKFKSIGDKQ